MNRSTWLWLGLVLWLVVFTAQITYFHPQLPERVATHFNVRGEPDGWSGKGTFLAIYLATLGGVTLLFPVLAWLTPRIPAALVNLPHKEYWLAPERRPYVNEWLKEFTLGMGHLTSGLLFAIMQMTLQANLQPQPRLSNWTWVWLGVYLVLVFGLTGRLVFLFRRP